MDQVNNRKGKIDMAKNPLGKSRDVENPYATFMAGDFEIRVLKTYKIAKNENGDQYARWYTVAKSPMTYGSWEYGDTYRKEVTDNFRLTYASPEFIEAYRDDPHIKIAA
jgi:hypothetical protein